MERFPRCHRCARIRSSHSGTRSVPEYPFQTDQCFIYSILWIFWIPRLFQVHSDLVSPRVPVLRYRSSGRYCFTFSGARDRARILLAHPPSGCLPLRAPGLGRATSVLVAFGALLFLSSVTLRIYKFPFTFTEAQNRLFYLLSLRLRIFSPGSEETKIYKKYNFIPLWYSDCPSFPLSQSLPDRLFRSLRVSLSPELCRNSSGSVAARVQTFLGFLDWVRFPMTQSPPVFLF